MSKKNIISKDKIDNNTVRVSFTNLDGVRVYEYKGAAMRSIMRGKDPASLTSGRLVDFRPKEH